MSNPLVNGKTEQQPQMNPQQMLAQLKSDPIGMLKQAGYNVPNEISNNPSAIIQHLVNSGQIPKNRLMQIAQVFGRR